MDIFMRQKYETTLHSEKSVAVVDSETVEEIT